MRVEYDKAADAAYIRLTEAPASGRIKSRKAGAGIVLDFDSAKRLVGIEVLDASEQLPAELLADGGAPDAYTLGEAAAVSGLSPITLRSQIRNGRIEAEKRGRDWLIPRSELATYLESRDVRGRPSTSRKGRRRQSSARR